MKALASITLAALTLLVSRAATGQDAIRFGVPSGAGPFTVPITVSDTAGTPLGVDGPAGQRIQAFAITVRFTPPAAVTSATLGRAGLLAGRTPVFETTAEGAGTITWVGSFDEAGGAIPFAQPPGAGDQILALSVTLVTGATVSTSLESATTTLSNQGGTVSESVTDTTLVLGAPVALPAGEAAAPPIPVLGPFALAGLALVIAAAGASLARRG
ncbi:MAG: hypothetical protein ACYDBY_16280 [Thermoanaerobaculia bacterium]